MAEEKDKEMMIRTRKEKRKKSEGVGGSPAKLQSCKVLQLYQLGYQNHCATDHRVPYSGR